MEQAKREMTYSDVVKENKELVENLEKKIKSGNLLIDFDKDFYLYEVFRKLGNSHPLKYVDGKRLEVLMPIQSILASIDDDTVDLYKQKGTANQDLLYKALEPHQRTLGVKVSTRLIGELAIAAYSTNKHLSSLSAECFGYYYGRRTLGILSQSIESILEYPLIESGKKDFTYGFVTIPNIFYHYLEEQEGKLTLNKTLLEILKARIEENPIHVVEDTE